MHTDSDRLTSWPRGFQGLLPLIVDFKSERTEVLRREPRDIYFTRSVGKCTILVKGSLVHIFDRNL